MRTNLLLRIFLASPFVLVLLPAEAEENEASAVVPRVEAIGTTPVGGSEIDPESKNVPNV